jgi:hypothetical protein
MSVTISTKVPEELAERIEEAQEEGESKSAAVRRLIRAGLDGGDAEYHVPPHLYAVFMGSVLFLAPITDSGTISGGAMMGLGALLVVGAFVYEFTQ